MLELLQVAAFGGALLLESCPGAWGDFSQSQGQQAPRGQLVRVFAVLGLQAVFDALNESSSLVLSGPAFHNST